jgi:hypothetical protein
MGATPATQQTQWPCWPQPYQSLWPCKTNWLLVGKSARNSAEFHDCSDSGPFELRNFHWNFIFPIIKCVLANLEHVPTGSESSPAINSSNFMNCKMSLLYLSVVSGIKFLDSMHQLFLHTPLPSHCSQYLPNTHKFMKTLVTYQGIVIVVEVPIQAKMDVDNEDLADFHFGSSQESKIDPPLVLDSVWDFPGITIDTFVMMVRPSRAGAAIIALFLAIVVVLDSSSTIMHLRFCHTLQRGRTL